MYGKIRVSLSLDELTAIKAAMRLEMERIDQLVDSFGDPHGTRAEDRALAEGLYNKLGSAFKRSLASGRV